MIYAYNPTYVESFQALLENLSAHRLKNAAGDQAEQPKVARLYVNPDDDRAIQGADDQEIQGMYEREENKDADGGLKRDPSNAILKKGFD